MPPCRSNRRPACASHPSADLAGRSVALARDIPVIFDRALAPHHRLVGCWALSRDEAQRRHTRVEARRLIETAFETAVLDVLAPVDIVDFRVAVVLSEVVGPPAAAIVCQSAGQIELGWIETSDAPIPWRATAYQAIGESLGVVLPVFGYNDLFEEISIYYWDGAFDDETARQSLAAFHGLSAEEIEQQPLPSQMEARRPPWMLPPDAAESTHLPARLRRLLRRLERAHAAARQLDPARSAWHFDWDVAVEYVPDIEECSRLPPMTLVPLNRFTREFDDIYQHGMEMGFMDLTGLCLLHDADMIDAWLASLRVGAELLIAVQDLVRFDPANS